MLYNLVMLLPCAVCLIYALQLTCRRKENSKSQNILALCLLLTSVSLLIFTNSLSGVTGYSAYIVLDVLDAFVSPVVFPLMYLYFKSLSSEKLFNWKDYLLVIPAIVIGSCTLVLYLVMGEEDAINYIQCRLIGQPLPVDYTTMLYKLHYLISVKLYSWILLIQTVMISAYTIYSMLRYHSKLKDFYSNLNDKSMEVDNKLMVYFLLSGLFATVFALTGRTFWIQHPTLTVLFFIIWAAVYFGLGYNGSKLKYSVESFAQDLQEEVKNDGQDMDGMSNIGRYNRHLPTFNKLIGEERIFLQSTLRADELAAKMRTNRTYLSRMIKEEFQCSFSDYINRKRIEHAQKLMQENPDIKLAELADKSGFININSFGRTFKQVVGLPPKEWLIKNLKHL